MIRTEPAHPKGCAAKNRNLLAVDWGTTNLRAYLTDGRHEILQSRSSDKGVMHVPASGFLSAFLDACQDWIQQRPDTAVWICGMAGGRQGWVETGYVPCPARLEDLAAKAARLDIPGLPRLWFAPGLSCLHGEPDQPEAMPQGDVMRGEEVQIFGAALALGLESGVFCLPGSHSKWARLRQGEITSFRTYPVGELYDAILHHTVMGKLVPDEPHWDEDAFEQGVRLALGSPNLLGSLFAVRANSLLGLLDACAGASFLSGLLIGREVAEATAFARSETVALVGSGALIGNYAKALKLAGKRTRSLDGRLAVVSGLTALHRRMEKNAS